MVERHSLKPSLREIRKTKFVKKVPKWHIGEELESKKIYCSSENLSVFLSMLCASFDRKTLWVSQKLKKLSSKNHVFAKKWPKIDFCTFWIHFDHKSTVYRLICFPDRLYINCKPLISYFLLLWKLCWLNLI